MKYLLVILKNIGRKECSNFKPLLRGCTEGSQRVCEECMEGAQKVCGGCMECVQRVHGGCTEGCGGDM